MLPHKEDYSLNEKRYKFIFLHLFIVQKQTVEVGTAKPGEGRARRRLGLESGLQATFDPSITTLHELFKYVVFQRNSRTYIKKQCRLSIS